MRERTLVVLLSSIGIVVILAAGVVALVSYQSASTLPPSASTLPPSAPTSRPISAAVQTAYQNEVKSWPLALPTGVALPASYPTTSADPAEPQVFVSTFFRCAWEDSYLQPSATDKQKELALTNLTLWVRLPPGVTSMDQSDNVYFDDAIKPALGGDAAALRRLSSSTDCVTFHATKTTPAHGIVIAKPQVAILAADQIVNPCADASTMAPCDPAYGPNRTKDNGPRDGAMGITILDGAGFVRAYLVARGDNSSAIAERFDNLDLWALNCARRVDLTLYAGDTLNLDKYTVATVGNQDGSTTPLSATSKADCLAQTAIPLNQWTP